MYRIFRRGFGRASLVATTAALIVATGAGPVGAVVIVPTFDSSITSRANAAVIESAFNAAALQFDQAFANPATVNITVSWGSIAGGQLPSGDIGASLDNLSGPYSYANMVSDLTAAAKSNPGDANLASVVSHLPKTDPTKLNQFQIPYAEAQALGLLPDTMRMPDGYIGFNASTNFDFNPVGGISAGTYDFEGVASHEIEEVLGRITGLESSGPSWATPFDLFRYTATNVSSFSYGAKAYFSINGGASDLGNFNYTGGGDRSDWAAGQPDLQDAYFSTGTLYGLSKDDLTALDAMGWGSSILPSGARTFTPGTTSSGIGGAAGVPEPATWAMLICGFGLIGAVLRRRRRDGPASAV